MINKQLLISFCLLLFLVFKQFHLCFSLDLYSECSSKKYRCGSISDVDFPFWGEDRPEYCGHPKLKLSCEENNATIQIKEIKYQVLEIEKVSPVLKIARVDFLNNGLCSPHYGNSTLDTELFEYAGPSEDITIFYGCNYTSGSIFGWFDCNPTEKAFILPGNSTTLKNNGDDFSCRSRVTVRVSDPVSSYRDFMNSSLIEENLKEGYPVEYKVDFEACEKCRNSSGVCGYDVEVNRTTCYCRGDQSPGLKDVCASRPESGGTQIGTPTNSGSSSKRIWVIIGIVATVSSIMMLSAMILYFHKREECVLSKVTIITGKRDEWEEFDVEAFVRSHGFFAPRYSYATVKKMTSSFTQEIGKGGFGSVYKGKLPDGRLVAVKMLNTSKSKGEDFINEVASIGRTSHVNIVTLLGFCCEKKKRALIYEYMPNGSLDKFIFSKESFSNGLRLEWKTLYEISLGIAQGLEYLHRGCNTRILHFDIKPQNILLDEEFRPKISDFGLAKLWINKESIISMAEARGTIGYIAPEVFSRIYGGVSHKSDVYSFGMLVLEMVGGRKNFDSTISHTSEIYFPNQIFKKMEQGNEVHISGNMTEGEKEISQKMILTSFWCIQTNPADRPSMSKVVQMLQGSLQSIEFPPKPYLFSPTRSPQHSM